jgi:hypothetical protein
MVADKSHDLMLELLRIGLISIRNFSSLSRRDRLQESMLLEWAELCHTVPSVLMGGCKAEALQYFVHVQGATFAERYPDRAASSFQQAMSVLKELSELI